VVERPFGFEAGEVGDVGEDLLPVVDIEERGDDALAELVRLGGAEDGDPGGDDRQHQEQGRQQPPGAGQPEGAELDLAARVQLRQQDVGDQVAAEGEKDADPEHAAGSPVEAEVEGDDGEDGYRTQPVQPRHVALVALDGFRHRCPHATDRR
jgi:hypothetical protein